MADRYDLIFLGINVEDSERDAAISTIATVLEVDEEEIRHLVDNKTSAQVKEGIPIESARKYQKDILRLGGICNYRPAAKAAMPKLELTPIELPGENLVFTCPACEYKQEIPSEKEPLIQCPQCGIVPSKYSKTEAAKEERDGTIADLYDKIAATKSKRNGTIADLYDKIAATEKESDGPPPSQFDTMAPMDKEHGETRSGQTDNKEARESMSKLELTPIELPGESLVFSCPACEYTQEVPNEKGLPLQCPQCGIVPSKYSKIAAAVEEGGGATIVGLYDKPAIIREEIDGIIPSQFDSVTAITKETDRNLPGHFDNPAAIKKETDRNLPGQPDSATAIKKEHDANTRDQTDRKKEVRERMQRHLNNRKLREQHDQELAERHAKEERQRQLEEKIKKELNLSRLINTRLRLFGSATFLLLLGMGAGGGGVVLFYPSMHAKAVDQAATGNPTDSQEDTFQLPENDLGIPPQQDTLRQIFSFAHRHNGNSQQRDIPVETPSGNAPEGADTPQGNVKVARLDGKVIWREMAQDGEWDLFLTTQARKLADSGQPVKAYHLADAITSPLLKVKALGHLAEHFRHLNNITDSENLFNLMAVYINTLPDIGDRIDAQGILALSLWRTGDQEKAQQNLEAAEKLALTQTSPADNARTLARVASYQAQIGMKAEADANFRRVNTLIHSLSDKATLLGAYVKLAASYAESGSRGIALVILNESLTATQEQIKDKTAQNRLFGEIADTFAKLGDADAAMAAAGRLNPEMKDKAMYAVTRELAYADRLYDAMKSLHKIEAPEYKARAAALVSRLQRSHPDMVPVSAATQEKALAAQGQIVNPQDQSIVRGEFARYLAHTGQTQAAEEWARKALASTQAIEPAQERDAAYAVLSANLALANQAKLADDANKMIVAPSLAETVDRENGKIARLFSEM